jgi:glycosyltransferase involved in cell wall biosynthesis
VGRVLLVNSSLALGGLERQLILLAENLPDEWHPLIWTVDGGPYEQFCRERDVPLVVAGRQSRFDVSPACCLWRLMRQFRPQVVHSWHWMTTAAALPACAALRAPLIDGSIRRGDRPKEHLRPHRMLMRAARVVVANSRAGLAAYHIPETRGRVVYNGFDPARLEHCVPREADGLFTVTMCARMDGHKDFDTVLDAARAVTAEPSGNDDRGRWRFLLLGDGPARGRLAARARNEFAAGTVEVASAGLEVMSYLSQSDVGVLMTNPRELAEGCSNAILEYMACGLPVVCSESGGNREVVMDGETGFVISPRNAGALARELRRLRDDASQRRSLGQAGRARLLREFSLERMVSGYVGLYEAITGRLTPSDGGTIA